MSRKVGGREMGNGGGEEHTYVKKIFKKTATVTRFKKSKNTRTGFQKKK